MKIGEYLIKHSWEDCKKEDCKLELKMRNKISKQVTLNCQSAFLDLYNDLMTLITDNIYWPMNTGVRQYISPVKLKWSINRDNSEVTHFTYYKGYRAEVRNYPGTRSIDCFILNKTGDTVYYLMYDKLECTVKGMKQECIDWINKRKI